MVKPIKQFEISSLKVSGFKCFAEERSFSFGPMNAIFGHNAQGKSTIADAISYAITGVSFFGSNRMDRLRAPGKNISVELQIVDGEGQPHCLIRNRVGDNTDVFWDGQPIAAKDLNTVFAERDLFLAVFNPLYLIEVLGNKGRDLFERYMPEVPHEKVMEQLSEHNQSILAQNPFLSPEALVKQTRESIRELESTLTYCQGQQDLLRSQREQSGVLLADRQKELQDCRVRIQELESIRTTGFDGSDLKERLADLYSLHEEYVREQASLPQTDDLDAKFRDLTQKRAKREADVYHSQYAQALADTQKQINELGMELARHRHILAGLQPGIRCPMCYQTVTQETLPALKDEFEATIRRICAQGKELSGQLDELHGLDEKAREVFEAFRAQDIAMCNLELADIELRRQQAVDAVRAENERRQQKISEIREEIQNIELDLETGRLSSEEMVELECFKERAKALEAEIEVLTEQQGSSMGADVAPGISAEEINAEIVKKNELLIQGLQVRLDDEKNPERKYRWLASRGRPHGVRCPAWIHVTGNPSATTAYLTEGGLKGDVASFLDDDALFLCFAGVTAVKHLEDTLRQMEQIQEVVITLDMDKLMNWRVQNALTKIIALVRSIRGIKIRVMNWNMTFKGIDDFYLARNYAAKQGVNILDMSSNFITIYLEDLWKREYPKQDRGFIHTCEWEELTLPVNELTADPPKDMRKAKNYLRLLQEGTADFPPLVCVNRMVIDGQHRFWAYRQAGFQQVKVYQNKPWAMPAAA